MLEPVPMKGKDDSSSVVLSLLAKCGATLDLELINLLVADVLLLL